jgi:lipoyl(octanoyl) transferase
MADARGTRPLIDVLRVGRMPYADAYEMQKGLLERRIAGEAGDTLMLTEHDPVVTVGRGASRAAVAGVQVPVFEIERGGEATYHGPGQVVGYPVIELPEGRRDLHRYLRDLEEVVIRVLHEFDVEGRRVEGRTGVWIGERKVCSIGVAVRRWVTWHGFALNVHTDLEGFRSFQPCGLDPEVMTRLVDHTDLGPGTLLVEVLVVKHFCDVFGYDLPPPGWRGGGGEPPRFPELPILG